MNTRFQTVVAGVMGMVLLGIGASARADVRAGVASAVNQQATGKPPTQDLRNLTTGLNVFRDEVIETSDIGQAQLLLNDGTALTVGPNATLVIDSFIYDPETSSGEMAMSLSKGVLRFVGGQLSKNQEVIIKTPVATMGIRGGIALISYDPVTRTAEGTFLFGEQMTITGRDGSIQKIRLPGFSASVSPTGNVGTPGKASSKKINAAITSLEGRPGADGGATEVPTNVRVAKTKIAAFVRRSGLGNVIRASGRGRPNRRNLRAAVDAITNSTSRTAINQFILNNAPMNPLGLFGQTLIQGQLIWNNASDLDLSLVLPGGAGTVSFFNTQVAFNGGGALAGLAQDNLGNTINFGTDIRVENIAVIGNNIPPGTYSFVVNNNGGAGLPPSPFVLFLTGDMGTTILPFAGLLGPGQTSPTFTITSTGTVVVAPPPPPQPPMVAPFAVATYSVDDTAAVTPDPDFLMIAKPAGDFAAPGTVSRGLIGNISFTGQDTAQVSEIVVATGALFEVSPGVNRFNFRFASTDFFDGVSTPLRPNLEFGLVGENPAGPPAFAGSTPPATFNVLSGSYDAAGNFVPSPGPVRPFTDDPTLITTLNDDITATLINPASTAIGLNRRTETLQGYATGIFNVRLPGDGFPGSYSLWNATNSPTDITAFTDAVNSGFGATFQLGNRVVVDGVPDDTGAAPFNITVNTINLAFGKFPGQPIPPGFTSISGTRGTYIDPDRFGALASRPRGGPPNGQRLAFVNGALIPTDLPSRFYLLSNLTDPDGGAVGLLLPGQAFCTCPAAKFGWWGGAINVASAGGGFTREDRVHAGTFVLGNLPLPGDLPVMGIANYAGHAAGVIRDNGVSYASVGSLTATWNFALRAGAAQITDFGGVGNVFNANLASPVNARDFTGALTSPTFPGLTGTIRGSFFATATDPSSDIGGVFRAADTNSGIFATGAFAATKQFGP